MEGLNFPLDVKMTSLPPSLFTGYIRDTRGKRYILVKAMATITDGQLVAKDTTDDGELGVIVAAAGTAIAIGVSNFGTTVNTGEYFWVLQKGVGYATSALTFTAGQSVMPAIGGGQATIVGANGNGVGVALVQASATIQSNKILFEMPAAYNG